MAASDPTLAQIIGIEQAVRGDADPWVKRMTEVLSKEALLIGTSEKYAPGTGNVPLPDKSARVQVNVTEALREFRAKAARYLDVTASKDWGNMGDGGARADIVIDGRKVAEDVPATYLLFLDKRLSEWQALFRKMPAQSLAEKWEESSEDGIWRTEPVQRPQMKKEQAFEVVVGPTEQHRAEIREVSKDVIAGWWTQSYQTSALPGKHLREVQERLAKLREAVQFAVHEANQVKVKDVNVSDGILGYVLDGTLA